MRAFPCQSAAAFPTSLPRRSRASLLWRSLATGVPLPLVFLSGASYSAMAPLPAASLPLRRSLPASLPLRPSRSAALPQRPGQQKLRHSAGQQLRYGAPASNKPHLAEKSTPVWLAIWRTWAGFANSQHRDAAFAIPDNVCAHSTLLQHCAAAQTDANLSAHMHRLPTPPTYLRRMRL